MKLKTKMFTLTLNFNRKLLDKSLNKSILQINRFQNGYLEIYFKFYMLSIHLNSIKLSENKKYHLTLFKVKN